MALESNASIPLKPIKPRRRTGFEIQAATVRALFMREIITRFGSYRLGYIWVLLEPGMHVAFMLVVFGTLISRSIPGMDFSVFLVSGILPWFMFSRSVTRALGAVEGNRGLFNYRPVMPIDAVIARTALEGVLYFNVYIFTMGILYFLGKEISFAHLDIIIITWAVLWVMSLGMALIMMVVGHISSEIAKFISIFIRILYFTSGIIYSIHVVPPQYQKYILWNPIVHGIEYMRNATDPEYPAYHVSYGYFCFCTLILIFLGLLFYKSREKRMLTIE